MKIRIVVNRAKSKAQFVSLIINELSCNYTSNCHSFWFYCKYFCNHIMICLSFQWNEVTCLFRAGMPLRKHRQNFRNYSSCFMASAAVDWLHQLLCNNCNFGPDVTRQQTVQLLKKFLKNHVIEDVKGRWGAEDLEDNSMLYRWVRFWSCKNKFKLSQEIIVTNQHILDCLHPLFFQISLHLSAEENPLSTFSCSL